MNRQQRILALLALLAMVAGAAVGGCTRRPYAGLSDARVATAARAVRGAMPPPGAVPKGAGGNQPVIIRWGNGGPAAGARR
jgi:hypothetical protein